MAKQAMISLGMAELLQKDKKNWDIPPVLMSQDVDFGNGNKNDEDLLDEISPEML